MTVEDWRIEEETGYKPKTTFYTDFSIAEKFGVKGIRDTFNQVFAEWKGNYEYMTELALALNWKCWRWYEVNGLLCAVYKELFERTDEWCVNNLQGEQLDYYYQTTD